VTTGLINNRYELPGPADTMALGRALASVLRAGDLVVLTGPLGAGKTVIAKGIGAGLGVLGVITSPTFVIARIHRPDPDRGGTLPMVHVDAYRLSAAADPLAEIDDLDLDATFDEAVTVVEWGEGLVERLTDAHLEARVDRDQAAVRDQAPVEVIGDPEDGAEPRVVTLVPHGGDWVARLTRLDLF